MLAAMQSPGSFKIAHRPRLGRNPAAQNTMADPYLDPLLSDDSRSQRVLASLRSEIIEGGGGRNLRIRRVFRTPREIFRLELTLPELGYQRTTLLDRDALEELLEADEVRAIVGSSALR
jgi:hypothetical protein